VIDALARTLMQVRPMSDGSQLVTLPQMHASFLQIWQMCR
jgi:hypothetical protein